MRIKVAQPDLKRASERTHSIVGSNSPFPVEEYVLFEASDGTLRMRTSHTQREAIARLDAEVLQPGAVLVRSQQLNQVVRRLVEGSTVSLASGPAAEDEDPSSDPSNSAPTDEYGDRRLRMAAAGANFSLEMLDPAEFPQPAEPEQNSSYRISGAQMRELLQKTYRSVAADEIRYFLQGVYLHPAMEDGGQRLVAVATDVRRLSKMSIPAPEGSEEAEGKILPLRTVTVLRQFLGDAEEVVVTIGENIVRFETSDAFELISPVIDGKYPDYPRVIPRDNRIRMEFEKRALEICLARVTAIGDGADDRVTFQMSEGSAELSVRSRNGQSRDRMAAIYNDQPMTFVLQANHIRDAIAHVDSDEFVMRARDEHSAFLVDEENGDARMVYLMMPHRA